MSPSLAVCALGIAACGSETAAPGPTGPGSSANDPREWEGSRYPRPHHEYADYEGTPTQAVVLVAKLAGDEAVEFAAVLYP